MPWAQPRSLLGRRTVRVKPGTEGWRAGAFRSGQHERAGRIDSPVPSRGHMSTPFTPSPPLSVGRAPVSAPRTWADPASTARQQRARRAREPAARGHWPRWPRRWALPCGAHACGLGTRNGAAARHGHSRLPGPRGPPNLETRMLGPRAAPADGCPDGRPRRRALSGVPGCLGRQRLRSPRSLP